MTWTHHEKRRIMGEVVDRLKDQSEVRRVVVFGSFLTSPEPHDLDVAIFQDSQEAYLPLALKYRQRLRPVADQIALDVAPLRSAVPGGWFVRDEVLRGETIYER
jgi:predicted nucleotidyltransferase